MRLAILLLCVATSVAHAQPAHMMASPTGSSNTATGDEKSASTAVFLSLSIPLLGGAAVVASHGNGGALLFGATALFLGPAVGRWYTGESAALGLGLRAGGVLALGVGLVGIYGISESDCRANDQPCHSPAPFEAAALGGATLIVGSTIYDIVQAKRGADRFNARHALTVTPGVVGTTRTPGLVVSGRF